MSVHLDWTLCEGEIEGIVQEDGVDQIYINNELYTSYGNRVYYEFFNGSATQTTCATLHSAIPAWDDPLRYTAYLYVRLAFHEDYFQSLPEITVKIQGTKVLNLDTSVTEYTRNPAWHAYDFLTRPSQRGGMGIDSARVNAASFIDAADYCDTKGWYCD